MANPRMIFSLLVLVCNAVLGLDVSLLSDNCLNSNSHTISSQISCSTQKAVKIQKYQEGSQTFYCIAYEKRSVDRSGQNETDTLSFELHEDYELKFTGSNVISTDATNPKFKLYDVRSLPVYKGRFAFSSNNPDFDITKIQINGVDQVCTASRKQVWPSEKTLSSTPTLVDNADERCGQIKRSESLGTDLLDLPSIPGKFPWVVAIYRYFDDEEETYYKCAGTIIGKRTIVTSVNCLLEDGLLLDRRELQVYVSPFSLTAKRKISKSYKIAEVVTHEKFNYQLDNNLAVLKLTRDIMFDDFVRAVCMPNQMFDPMGKIGKFAGYGKSSSRFPVKTELLTQAEYEVKNTTNPAAFIAENTSGNNRISDIGGGLYIDDGSKWTLAGVMSKKASQSAADSMNKVFTFTNAATYSIWIQKHNLLVL